MPSIQPVREGAECRGFRSPIGGEKLQNADELARENEALRDRLSRLSEASLRINQSLDLDTVLQGVLDSARTLTGARYGVITLLDDSGGIRDFLSSGMTVEEAGQLWDLPGGMRLFEYLNAISEPLRLPDLLGHIRSLGLPEFRPPLALGPVVSFLAAPVLHRGQRAGNVYVAEKEAGVEFTREDEETLVMFASQAALVIANARTHREEQRARTDLETLVDTSPVGVVVFDARTGAPVSFNLEARRIVDGLREPDQSPEQLLEVLTVRRADGREVSLRELPLAQALNTGETVRAEEIVLRVPDGRSVTTLINATPIRPEGGGIESYVVTLQDLTALEELERLRAEFLAMVSHELRTPLTSVKGAVTSLLDPAAGLNPTETLQFFRIIDAQADRMRRMISDLLDVARIETGDLSVSPEPAEVALLVSEAANAFRSGGGRHGIDIDLAPELPWVMADRLRLVQVLGNLLANAARNSAESSPIRVSAVAEGFQVAVSVSDQGRGIPAESLPRLFRKFSRVEGDEPGGDTGLGLAICKGIVEAHGGRIRAESGGPGLGASFTFTVPMVEQAGFVSPAGLPRGVTRSPRRPPAAEQVRVLAVDDDPQALRYVRDALTGAGYTLTATGDPEEALRLMASEKPQLVLLDLVLPGTDGVELMQGLRGIASVPVIFLSAYGQEDLIARAFDMGAADYVVKPFAPTELAARIRAALRRGAAPEPLEPCVLGDLVVNYAERLVTLAGSPVTLTAIEYRTLAELAANAGRVLTYEHLLRQVWGMEPEGDVRPMRTVISSLRRKLGDDADNPAYIFTEPRVGYRLAGGEGQGPEEQDG